MAKRGLPNEIKMRHDLHYVEELARPHRPVGKLLSINKIEPNPEQPRVEVGDLTELANSIRQNGILEPLLVKPLKETGSWMIIAGERRWRAATMAGLKEVPCIELDVDEKAIAEIALIENLQRKDLTVWEEADGLAALARQFGYTHEEIAKKISKSRTTVTESLTLARIPHHIREKCRQAGITAKSTLLEVARQFDDQAMEDFVKKISLGKASRETVRKVSRTTQKSHGEKNNNNNNPALKNEENSLSQKSTFVFTPESADFELSIRFRNNVIPDKNKILQALKLTFNTVKVKRDLT